MAESENRDAHVCPTKTSQVYVTISTGFQFPNSSGKIAIYIQLVWNLHMGKETPAWDLEHLLVGIFPF